MIKNSHPSLSVNIFNVRAYAHCLHLKIIAIFFWRGCKLVITDYYYFSTVENYGVSWGLIALHM